MSLMVTLLLSLFLLQLLLGKQLLAQKAIPNDIRKKVREARTIDDLLSTTQFSYASHLLKKEDEPTFIDQKESIRTRKIKLYSSSNNAAGDDFHQDIDANTRKNLEILSTIRQGTDLCQLQKACIPILLENPDPALLIFPRCYEVEQCVGSCCESTESCHPIDLEYIQKPIVEILYSGNNLFVINQTRNITIEQHTACSCKTCTRFGEVSQCPQKKIIGPNCDCECRNKDEKEDCQDPNKVWNDETCTCSCGTMKCYGGNILDTHTCLCSHQDNNECHDKPLSRCWMERMRKVRRLVGRRKNIKTLA